MTEEEKMHHEAAIAAMQGFLANPECDYKNYEIIDASLQMADTYIKQLKEVKND